MSFKVHVEEEKRKPAKPEPPKAPPSEPEPEPAPKKVAPPKGIGCY